MSDLERHQQFAAHVEERLTGLLNYDDLDSWLNASQLTVIKALRDTARVLKDNGAPAYDPEYGDRKICECGHEYNRHFDSYEDMAPMGCKYCFCYGFRLRQEEKSTMDGYAEALKMDREIEKITDYQPGNAEWTGRSLDDIQELIKFVRTVGTTLNLLEQSLNAALSQRLKDVQHG